MDPIWITILVFGILIFGLIMAIALIRNKSPTPPDIASMLDQIPNPQLWSTLSNVPNGNRNSCGIYTFQGTMNSDGTFNPGTPNLNKAILDSMTPTVFDSSSCISPDQIVAQQQQRTCEGVSGTTGGCYSDDGTLIPVGSTEILYVGCPAPQCTGSFGAVALNFNPPPITAAFCLQGDPTLSVSAVPCNLGNLEQLWQIDRTSSIKLAADPNGSYARIYSRSQQGCLQPLGTVMAGVSVGIGPCTTNSGYVWVVVGAQTFADGTQAPQQIVYWPVWPVSVPANFIGAWALHRNATTGNLELQPYAVYSTNSQTPGPIPESDALLYTAQILDYTLYNTLVNIPTDQGYVFPPIPTN